MKKEQFYLMVLAFISLMFWGISMKSAAQEQELKLPCTEMKSTKGFLRGWGTATSSRAMVARKKARISAMVELASSLETTIESATQNCVTEVGTNDELEGKSLYTDEVKTSIKKVLKGVVSVCDEWTRDKATGKYVSYVVVEIPTGDFSKAVAREVAKSIEGKKDNDNGPTVDAKELEEKFNEEFYKMFKE